MFSLLRRNKIFLFSTLTLVINISTVLFHYLLSSFRKRLNSILPEMLQVLLAIFQGIGMFLLR